MDLKTFASNAAAIAGKILEVAGVLAPIVPGGAGVVEIVKLVTAVGSGLVNAEPAMVALYDEIKATAAGGPAPTAEQWADWNARADKAHDDLNAALDAT